MRLAIRGIGIVLALAAIQGCAGHSQATDSSPTAHEARGDDLAHADLNRIIQNITNAPDGRAEADALNRLHDWMTDHRMTYHVMVENAQNQSAAPAAPEANYPLRVTVEIYQGEQRYRTFQFVPRDNRNLTALGLT
jgi:hypothetical protein